MEKRIEDVLIEASRTRQRKEPVERAVGRAVRRRGMDYGAYIAAMSELRDLAASLNVDIDEALRSLQKGEKD